MARKVDVSYMKMVYTDDEWVREVKEPTGTLTIVDLYTKAWGPCEMLAGHFLNFFFDFGTNLSIRFARAERDKLNVPDLADIPISSQPVFLFFLDGALMEKVDGPIIPRIKECINKYAPPVVKS
ncbi:hypothetical protein AB1Y20_008900 [Prymnesium parvum]|uniref:Thioredoxin domain-containing protein n=1 Tax=Prymnesium parvum TaxID=97485 RepID=A0AB34K0L2_PRYPA